MSVLSPRNYMCIQRVEIGVVLRNNYNVVPRFLASLLHLSLMLNFSDFTASFPEVNLAIPFVFVPPTHRKTLLKIMKKHRTALFFYLCHISIVALTP